jgi:hypothetical protein
MAGFSFRMSGRAGYSLAALERRLEVGKHFSLIIDGERVLASSLCLFRGCQSGRSHLDAVEGVGRFGEILVKADERLTAFRLGQVQAIRKIHARRIQPNAFAAAVSSHGMGVRSPLELSIRCASNRGPLRSSLGWVHHASPLFRPVPDETFGWRLHMADLAVNKALAAGGRRQVRDYAHLALIHRHMIPLWHICWAAPGKDESWSPVSLVEKIAAKGGFRQADFDAELSITVPRKASEVLRMVREAVEQARNIPTTPSRTCRKAIHGRQGWDRKRCGQDFFEQREHRRGYERWHLAILVRYRPCPDRPCNRCIRLGGRSRTWLRPLLKEVVGRPHTWLCRLGAGANLSAKPRLRAIHPASNPRANARTRPHIGHTVIPKWSW